MVDYDIDNDARDVLQDFIDNSPEGLESDEQLEAPLIIDLDEVNKEAQNMARLITERLSGYYFDEDVIKLREIFSFKQTGLTDNGEVIGEFMMHKKIPNVYKKIKYRGIETLKDIFG